MSNILTYKFFSNSTLAVAQRLLGKYLVRKVGRRMVAVMVTEVEAYDGSRDKASHASRGRTKRNAVMFGPAGCWYVYFTYGMHWMLNIVTGKEGYPAAVLVRGIEVEGKRIDGPARLTRFLKINNRFNKKPATRRAGLWIEDRGVRIPKSRIRRTARIGVEYAGPVWAKKRYRFLIQDNK